MISDLFSFFNILNEIAINIKQGPIAKKVNLKTANSEAKKGPPEYTCAPFCSINNKWLFSNTSKIPARNGVIVSINPSSCNEPSIFLDIIKIHPAPQRLYTGTYKLSI